MWIEVIHERPSTNHKLSRLARALWIEVDNLEAIEDSEAVEARESLVDRSLHQRVTFAEMRKSRLARALWIEVPVNGDIHANLSVEARESLVDRSLHFCGIPAHLISSRLARALWIEVLRSRSAGRWRGVEARESLVDRSRSISVFLASVTCRGSREPCGSKSHTTTISLGSKGRGSREPCGLKSAHV